MSYYYTLLGLFTKTLEVYTILMIIIFLILININLDKY